MNLFIFILTPATYWILFEGNGNILFLVSSKTGSRAYAWVWLMMYFKYSIFISLHFLFHLVDPRSAFLGLLQMTGIQARVVVLDFFQGQWLLGEHGTMPLGNQWATWYWKHPISHWIIKCMCGLRFLSLTHAQTTVIPWLRMASLLHPSPSLRQPGWSQRGPKNTAFHFFLRGCLYYMLTFTPLEEYYGNVKMGQPCNTQKATSSSSKTTCHSFSLAYPLEMHSL